MSWTRRDLLLAAGALAAVAALPSCTAYDPGPDYVYDGSPADRERFVHGVASGDPLTDSVILWTRVELGDDERLEVYVEVYATEALEERVAARFVEATAARDGCVKVDVDGLRPGRTYHYRFRCQDQTSVVGRTRTAPSRGRDPLRMGVASCSHFAGRWFHAYRFLAEQDLHLIAHLGDYIYETGGGSGERVHEPRHEIVSLADYRRRYSQYRSDRDLQEAHRMHPWVMIWDDHETANNSWRDGAANHNEGEGDWDTRLAAAAQAWLEWLPVRESAGGEIYRALQWGSLATLFVLDTRITGREEQTRSSETIGQPERQLLGAEQEAWLLDGLAAAETDWVLLLQQVVMAPWGPDGKTPFNEDAWDGYPAARRRIMDVCAEREGVMVLTGDVHSSWANEIPLDVTTYGQEGAVAVEVVTPGITSPGMDVGRVLDLLVQNNPHIRYAESTRQGCVVLEIGSDEAIAEWWHLEEGAVLSSEPAVPSLARSLKVERSTAAWLEVD